MAKDPAVLFYTSDFLTGTFTWTNEQVGAYIRLLCLQHQKGGLTENDISSVSGTFVEILRTKFEKNGDGLYYNKRMREEAIKRDKFCESRRKSIQMRYVRSSSELRTENENENENENKDLKTSIYNNKNKNSEDNQYKKEIFDFESIWGKYPRRVGKKMAEKHFMASIKTKKDFEDLTKALSNYLSSKRVAGGFVQNGSTWFNNWRDWIDYKEEFCKRCNDKGSYVSATGYTIQCECPAGRFKK